jgi:hypothetical protein
MRPFRFFFVASLGLFLFFFFARFVIMALAMAAVLSFVFFLGRSVKNFFQRLDWRENDYRYYGRSRRRPVWKDDLLLEYPARGLELEKNYRVIKVQ